MMPTNSSPSMLGQNSGKVSFKSLCMLAFNATKAERASAQSPGPASNKPPFATKRCAAELKLCNFSLKRAMPERVNMDVVKWFLASPTNFRPRGHVVNTAPMVVPHVGPVGIAASMVGIASRNSSMRSSNSATSP